MLLVNNNHWKAKPYLLISCPVVQETSLCYNGQASRDLQIVNKRLQFTRAIRKTATSWLSAALQLIFCVCKTQCSYDWRSRPTFLQADFHASMKSAHKNVRVNCNKKSNPNRLLIFRCTFKTEH